MPRSNSILIFIFSKLRVPAALLSGTLVASGFLQITEIAYYQISPKIVDYCLLILGASVGCRFADKTFNEVAKNAFHSFVATFLLVLLGLAAAFAASLIIDKKSLSKDLEITAETKDGLIMGVRHKKYHVHGVQFHPESIRTKIGIKILKNFIRI